MLMLSWKMLINSYRCCVSDGLQSQSDFPLQASEILNLLQHDQAGSSSHEAGVVVDE